MRYFTAFMLGVALLASPLAIAQQPKIEIPYQKFVLSNGLTVLVHEDHKAPIVAVNIWYHVGSKNEKRGKTGFAHLFEHLMFNGSEHFNTDYFKGVEKLGATDLNGTTNQDRTNYFQNVPASALDTILWLESDRMGYMVKAIDKARLDEQRGVVQNEKRQGENQPYGLVYQTILENTYPSNHPYSWSVIGSMEDLNAASLEDVHEWFKTYYGPSNAVLVIAGDIDAKTAKEKVAKYFGAIPPGPPVAHYRAWVPKVTGQHRKVMQDRVPQARVYKVWNVPQEFTEEQELLSIAAEVLGGGKTSRLYRRLVYQDQIATDANAMSMGSEISGQFWMTATARPGVDLSKVEKALDEELKKFLAEGPTEAEIARVKTSTIAQFVRGVERIGGFGGKSDVLARGQVFAGDPEAYKKSLGMIERATAVSVKAAANAWLGEGVFALEVHPFPQLKAEGTDVDRTKMPEAGTPPGQKLPQLQRAKLSNGLNVILAERHEVPMVNFTMAVDAGTAVDPVTQRGLMRLSMNMLDEGTKTRNALQISEQLESLGANLYTGSNSDLSFVDLSTLKTNVDKSLDVFADVILNPSFPEADFAREQKLALAGVAREKAQPAMAGMRVFPSLVFGKEHPYGSVVTESTLREITRDALVKTHQAWFKPNNATLVVVGDTTLAEVTPKLEKLFAGWKPAQVPKKSIAAVQRESKQTVYIIDKPGAIQSVIYAGHLAPPKNAAAGIANETLNMVLGGSFTSRINMNLREDKHWTYGARSGLGGNRGQRTFFATAPVQSDKTKESMQEILNEFRGISGNKPVTEDELQKAQAALTLRLPGALETSGAVGGSILELIQFGLPENYHTTYAANVRALKLADMVKTGTGLVHPDGLIWVVVGDRGKIEPGIRELNLGDIRVIDADGNPVQ